MVSQIYNPEMSRTLEASCLKCEKLHTSCYSFIREGILSQNITVSDYARWGCIKYRGPGMKIAAKNTRALVYETLKSGEKISLRVLSERLSLDKQIVSNNITRLRKRGIPVLKQAQEGDAYYQLATM